MIPKVKFRKMTIKENIDIIKWAFYEKGNSASIHDLTINYFTELSKFDENTPRKIVYKTIEEIVSKEYNKHLEEINNEIERYNNLWNKYNSKYFSMLENYFNIEYPNKKIIDASIGLIPIFPRYLEKCAFSVGTNIDEEDLIRIIAHETLHFIWFKKWQQLYPKISKKEYESPYIVWQYSEMVTDPILNNKPFNKLFPFKEKGYDNFYKLYDKDILVMDKLRNIYSLDICVEEKIKIGYEYIKTLLHK